LFRSGASATAAAAAATATATAAAAAAVLLLLLPPSASKFHAAFGQLFPVNFTGGLSLPFPG